MKIWVKIKSTDGITGVSQAPIGSHLYHPPSHLLATCYQAYDVPVGVAPHQVAEIVAKTVTCL